MREEGRPELTNLAVLLSGHYDTDHRLSIFNDLCGAGTRLNYNKPVALSRWTTLECC